ncbi:DUF2461 domain-containing protein [Nioella sp.]|uniref:DUF2461 domain-containing protein n=1 Tax=Nioella sp. TaxID=1912091 RepID=UPI003B528BE5
MSSTTIPVTVAPDAFAFLENLAANNDREWFNANKKTFATELERPFVHLLETLSARLTDASRPLSGGKATVFRMNRDVRFSDDKRPYKTNLSGLLTPSGTKKELGGIVYLHLDAQGGFAAAGLYNLTPAQLGPIRDTMIADAKGFAEVKAALARAGRHFERTDSLTAMPKGYAEHAEHPHAEELKLKSLILREDLDRDAWLSGGVALRVEALARDAMPLLAFAETGR